MKVVRKSDFSESEVTNRKIRNTKQKKIKQQQQMYETFVKEQCQLGLEVNIEIKCALSLKFLT